MSLLFHSLSENFDINGELLSTLCCLFRIKLGLFIVNLLGNRSLRFFTITIWQNRHLLVSNQCIFEFLMELI